MFKLPSQLVHFQKWLAFSHSLYEAGCLGEFNGSEPARDLQESRIQSTESVKTFCLRHFCFAESCQVSLWVPILAWTTSTITLPIAKACNISPLSFMESIRRRWSRFDGDCCKSPSYRCSQKAARPTGCGSQKGASLL